jgi:hypothetical protein
MAPSPSSKRYPQWPINYTSLPLGEYTTYSTLPYCLPITKPQPTDLTFPDLLRN